MQNIRLIPFILLFIFCISSVAEANNALTQKAMNLVARDRYTEAHVAARMSGSDATIAAVTWYQLTRSPNMPDFSAYEQFITRHPGWPLQDKLLLRAELAMLGNHTSDASIASWFKRYPPQTAYGRFKNTLLKGQPITDALITDTWINADFTEAKEKEFYGRYQSKLTRDHTIRRASRLLWEDRISAAQRLYPYLTDDYKKLFDARIKLMTKANGVDGFVDRVPASLRNDVGLLFDRMRYRAYKKNYPGVEELLLAAPATVPYPQKWWPQRQLAIRNALDGHNYGLAYRLAAAHGQTERLERSEALWLKGWIALVFRNSASEAYTDFSQMYEIVSYPISRSRAAYWAGRAAKAAGKPDAKQWFGKAGAHPTTFYGQLALLESSAAPKLSIPWPAAPRPGDAPATLNKTDLGRTVMALGSAGALDQAWPFLLQLVETAGSEANARAIIMTGLYFSRPDISLKAAKEAQRFGWTITEAAFPTPKLPEPLAVDTAYALAISRQESLFNPKALSPAGARGLMQVMPATGRMVARRHKMSYADARLFEPAYCAQIGSYYLRELLDSFRGAHVLSTAGYNAGPGRPRQWQTRNGVLNGDLYQAVNWIEMIPFSETRNYVQRVLENQQVYRYLLSQGKAPLTLKEVLAGNKQDFHAPL